MDSYGVRSPKKTGERVIGSDGSVEYYPDVYKDINANDAQDAQQQILQLKGMVEVGQLRIGEALEKFERQQLYLGCGASSFRQWCNAPDVAIGYRVAHDLIRIVRDLLPTLMEHNAPIPTTVSAMRTLLPVLSDGDTERVVEAAEAINGLTVRDAKERIKELRGIAPAIEQPDPAVFRARVRHGEAFHTVHISCTDGVDFYNVGTLNIKPGHFARWQERFGAFIEYE